MPRFLLLLLVVLLLPAPGLAADAKASKITYDEHVVPVLRDKCFACHNQDRKSGGLRLNTFTNIMAGGASGPAVKPGDPDGSLLFKLVTHKEEPYMPPKSPKLPAESLALIENWIRGGALENSGSKTVVMNKPKYEIALGAVNKGKPDGPPPMPQKLTLDPLLQTPRTNAIVALAASPWAPLVAVGGQKQVFLYHGDALDLIGVLPFPEGVPHVLRFSRNGSLLLAGGGVPGKSGKVVVWNVVSGERIFTVGEELDCVLAADISSDQSQIALGGPSKVVRVYSTRDGKLLHEVRKHTDWIYSIEYSPDGVLLATGDRNGGLFVWEAHTGREYFSLRGHTAGITGVSWRADSNVLASGSEDTTIKLWEMENGGQIKNWGAHGGGVQSVAFAKDGRIASCGRDRVAKMWDGNGAQQRAFEALPDVAVRVVFSHDAARVFCGDWLGNVRAWNTADGKPLGSLTSNPPTLAQRLELATQAVVQHQKTLEQLTAAAPAAASAAQKAAQELAAAEQSLTQAGASAKAATDALARVKDPHDKASAALAALQAQVQARDVLAKAYAEAAAKVKDAAEKNKGNAELQSAMARSRDTAALAAVELSVSQRATADLQATTQSTGAQLAAAQQAAQQATAAIGAATKLVETRKAAAAAAVTQANAAKAAVDQATAALVAAKAQLERVKAAQTAGQQASR